MNRLHTDKPLKERLPAFLCILSVITVVYVAGITVGHFKAFPFPLFRSATITLYVIFQEMWGGEAGRYHGEFLKFADVGTEDIAEARIRANSIAPARREDFLLFGGLNQYLDICPNHGCVAVRVAPDGQVIHGYPYLPGKIYGANIAKGFPYEYIRFDPFNDTRPIGMRLLPDGDLIVTFQITFLANVFPHGTGVARLGPNGLPRWFRFDYSHHWPTIASGDEFLIPGLHIGSEQVAWTWPSGERYVLECETNRPYGGTIRRINGTGELIRVIRVLDAILASPHFAVLQHTTDGCNPIHLNFIDEVRKDVPADLEGISPGDLVVSLRNISAFGIIDRESGKLKRLVRGTFIQQHSVQHLSGGKFLIFDNHGGGQQPGASRLLEIDLKTGKERTVFPTKEFQQNRPRVFSRAAGYLSISTDRKRALVNYSYQGTTFEVRLSDGAVLREFVSIHDVSRVEAFPNERSRHAAIFRSYGVDYVPH